MHRIKNLIISLFALQPRVTTPASADAEKSAHKIIDKFYHFTEVEDYESMFALFSEKAKVTFKLRFGALYPSAEFSLTPMEAFLSNWQEEAFGSMSYLPVSVKTGARKVRVDEEKVEVTIAVNEKYITEGKELMASGIDSFLLRKQEGQWEIVDHVSKRTY